MTISGAVMARTVPGARRRRRRRVGRLWTIRDERSAPVDERGGPYDGGHVPRRGGFFDLDKTIIAKSSAFVFGKPFQAGGLISRRAVLRSAYAQFVFLVGGADHDQMEKMRQFMSSWCAGWEVGDGARDRRRDAAPRRRPDRVRRGGQG